MNCRDCQLEMIPGFSPLTGYCPNECDLKRRTLSEENSKYIVIYRVRGVQVRLDLSWYPLVPYGFRVVAWRVPTEAVLGRHAVGEVAGITVQSGTIVKRVED